MLSFLSPLMSGNHLERTVIKQATALTTRPWLHVLYNADKEVVINCFSSAILATGLPSHLQIFICSKQRMSYNAIFVGSQKILQFVFLWESKKMCFVEKKLFCQSIRKSQSLENPISCHATKIANYFFSPVVTAF